ncbi:hypothetical protein ACROYT_G012370 [Oculina patagonica]
MNDNGERLCDFGSANRLVITGTIFPHKEIHKLTWRSPDGRTVNQIDHVLVNVVNGRMRTSILDTRVMRGADVYSDHYLVRTRKRLKLARIEGKKIARERLDVCKLQSEEIRRRYNIEVRNRFEALGDIEDPEEEHGLNVQRCCKESYQEDALKGTKPGKAPEVDEVGPELLKVDMEDTAHRLTRCYNRLCETERWPEMWKKGLVVKIFKKGDLRDCNNWTGVTLLPIISKIFCKMLLERIKRGVDRKLRMEQAELRSKRSTTEQIIMLIKEHLGAGK